MHTLIVLSLQRIKPLCLHRNVNAFHFGQFLENLVSRVYCAWCCDEMAVLVAVVQPVLP